MILFASGLRKGILFHEINYSTPQRFLEVFTQKPQAKPPAVGGSRYIFWVFSQSKSFFDFSSFVVPFGPLAPEPQLRGRFWAVPVRSDRALLGQVGKNSGFLKAHDYA